MKNISSLGVIGAGQMGSGIAQTAALVGINTILWDSNPAQLQTALKSVHDRLKILVQKSKLSEEDCIRTISNITLAREIEDFNDTSVVIEAIKESFEVKAELFKKLSASLNKDIVFASNTSSISITGLASLTDRPEKFVGIHFMNPVPVMRLVEIIRGLQTDDETFNFALRLCQQLNKETVIAKDSPGFIINRILAPMINEAIFLLQEGCQAKDIDLGMKLGTNQPMGPLELADFVGLDTLLSILKILHNELGDDKYRPSPLLVKYVEAGWLGKKTGRGFYNY